MPGICVPQSFFGLVTDYVIEWDNNVNSAGGSYGTINIWEAFACQKVLLLKSIPWSANTTGTVTSGQVIVATTGGIPQEVLAWLAGGFAPGVVNALKFLGYPGNFAVGSVRIQGSNIIIDYVTSSPLAWLVVVAVGMALLVALAFFIVRFVEIVIPALGVGINALLIAAAVGITIFAGVAAYSFVSSPEGRAQLRRGTARAFSYGERAGRKYLPRAAKAASQSYRGFRARYGRR